MSKAKEFLQNLLAWAMQDKPKSVTLVVIGYVIGAVITAIMML